METKNFIKNIESVKEKNVLDLSAWEDLSIALMNLVSLEEHSFFSYAKTKDEKFLKILEATREMRKRLLKLIVKDDDGSEKWCMSKHFLATSMRLYEVANRLLHEKKIEEAKSLYKDAAEMYGMFWMLNMKDKDNEKNIAFQFEKESPRKNSVEIDKKEEKGIFSTIKSWLECCNE